MAPRGGLGAKVGTKVAAVFLAGGVLAACGSSAHISARATPSTTNAGPPTSAVSPSGSSTTTSTTTSPSNASSTATTAPATTAPPTTAAGPLPCPTSALGVALGAPNGAAGSTYYVLTFTNTSKVSCTLTGYPGVSYVAGSQGTQIGAPAARLPGTVTTVTVQSGASAFASLREVVAGNYPSSCGLTNVAGLRIYPPNQTAALFVAQNTQGCSNASDLVLQVGPVASNAAGASS